MTAIRRIWCRPAAPSPACLPYNGPILPQGSRMGAGSPRPNRNHSLSRHRLAGFDYADPHHASFLTLRAQHGTPFSDPRLAGEVVASLNWLRANRGRVLYAWCLMPDHLHLLLQLTRRGHSVSAIVRAFQTYTTRQSWGLGYHGTLWQARFYDHIVRRSEDGRRIAAYTSPAIRLTDSDKVPLA